MDVREKLIGLIAKAKYICENDYSDHTEDEYIADTLLDNGVTVQECGEWVHPKGYVVSNGFLCSKCGHEEASHYPINKRSGGVCIADENGNFFYPPKLNYCPNCGVKMMQHPPKGE